MSDKEDINIDIEDDEVEPTVFDRLSIEDIKEAKERLEEAEILTETIDEIVSEKLIEIISQEPLDIKIGIRYEDYENEDIRNTVGEIQDKLIDIISKSDELKKKLKEEFSDIVEKAYNLPSIIPEEIEKMYQVIEEESKIEKEMIEGPMKDIDKDASYNFRYLIERTEELQGLLEEYKKDTIQRNVEDTISEKDEPTVQEIKEITQKVYDHSKKLFQMKESGFSKPLSVFYGPEIQTEGGFPIMGQYDPSTGELFINEIFYPETHFDTIVHEVAHRLEDYLDEERIDFITDLLRRAISLKYLDFKIGEDILSPEDVEQWYDLENALERKLMDIKGEIDAGHGEIFKRIITVLLGRHIEDIAAPGTGDVRAEYFSQAYSRRGRRRKKDNKKMREAVTNLEIEETAYIERKKRHRKLLFEKSVLSLGLAVLENTIINLEYTAVGTAQDVESATREIHDAAMEEIEAQLKRMKSIVEREMNRERR